MGGADLQGNGRGISEGNDNRQSSSYHTPLPPENQGRERPSQINGESPQDTRISPENTGQQSNLDQQCIGSYCLLQL